jgi:hypothetical protein
MKHYDPADEMLGGFTSKNYSYPYTAEPSYYFGRKPVFHFMNLMHRFLPRAMTGSLFIFLRKP